MVTCEPDRLLLTIDRSLIVSLMRVKWISCQGAWRAIGCLAYTSLSNAMGLQFWDCSPYQRHLISDQSLFVDTQVVTDHFSCWGI